jgi:hypothetical protein
MPGLPDDQPRGGPQGALSRPDLMSVRTELVLETMVGRLTDRIVNLRENALPEPAASLLAESEDEALARDGYLMRIVEKEMFEPARQPSGHLLDQTAGDIREQARELARAEPLERPDPGEAPSWRVPGPGGHVRHYVALRLIEQGLQARSKPPPEGPEALKRPFMYGFFLRCCEEASL